MKYEHWIARPTPTICPTCKKPAVRERAVAVFDLPWEVSFDEVGRRHTHNPNGTGVLFFCGDGHDWEPPSCWCGWMRYQINERAAG